VHVCAAKAGVDMITKVLALEWGPEGIRINSVIPGPIEDTEGMRRLAPSEDGMERVRQTVPLRRNGQAVDIARMCMFLSSEEASYVSGVIVPVDGAWYLGGVGTALEATLKDLDPRK
ncbi:MAG: SDR family oxidoreductase, partial [Pseudomonadota bacterium]